MSTAHRLQVLAQLSANQLLNCLLLGIAVALLAWLFLRFSGRSGSVTRFAVWFSALLAIALLPVTGLLGMGLAVDSSAAHSALRLPHSWALYLCALWATVALLSLLKVAAGLFRLQQLRRSCTVVDRETLHSTLRGTLEGFRSRRHVSLCTSDCLNVPAAIGFFRPVVVFPTWATEELSVTELNSILLHELAHLARWDDWTNLTQKILRAILFFHPAVWWIDSRLALEREMACDDIVLARTANPRAYAECLVSLTEKGLLHRGFQLVQAAISRMRQTTLRVTQILDHKRSVTTTVGKPVFSVLAIAAFGCSMISPLAPRLVSFDSGAPVVAGAATSAAPTNGSLRRPAYLSGSARQIHSADAPRLTNAAFHPDQFSQGRRATDALQPVKLAPRKSQMTKSRTSRPRAIPARVAMSQPGIETPELREEVVLVVWQQRVDERNGQSMLTYSVYRFVNFEPGSQPAINPRKI